ncbi:MAG: hypothetical protein HYZ75_00380 [Elusimicrobia bacterium]|nr:hypothetical protein [Elusimicrobiota bacterium]
MRRPLAATLAAVLAVLDPALHIGPYAGRLFAEEPTPASAAPDPTRPSIDVNEAVGFLETNNVFRGPDDPLRTYVVDARTGQLSPIGEVIYLYLRSETPDRIREVAPAFEQLRQSGPATPRMLDAAGQSQQDLQTRFADLLQVFNGGSPGGGGGGPGSSPFAQNALLSVSFDGAARARGEPEYTQIETDDSYVFMDREGVAVRMAKNWACRHQSWDPSAEPYLMNRQQFTTFQTEKEASGEWEQWACGEQGGVTIFSRDIQKSQKAMNASATKPSCAPRVPETGRYNVEMLEYSACLLSKDVERSRYGYKVDLLVKLATMLGEHPSEEMILRQTDRLLAEYEAKAKNTNINLDDQHCGRKVTTAWDAATCKLKERDDYVKKSEEFLIAYQQRINAYKTREVITQAEIQGLQADEALVKKFLTLAYLEAQRGQAYTQLEGISWESFKNESGQWITRAVTDSPDSKALREALEKLYPDPTARANYLAQGGEIARRVERLLRAYDRIKEELLRTDHAGSMGVVQGALSSTQRELGEVGLDARLFTSVPIMTHLGNEENSGWSRSTYYGVAKGINWISGLWGGDALGGYIQQRDDLGRYVPAMHNVAALIGSGDFAGAREAMLSVDPNAQRTHWQVEAGSTGDDPSRTERTETMFRKINQTVTSLMSTHMWVDIGRDIVVSSIVLAVAAPAAAAVLSGIAKAAYTVANIAAQGGKLAKTAAFFARIVGGVAEHGAIRLNSLTPAANTLRQKTMWGRVLAATAIRGINAGVRHGVFALGMSGGVSGGINWASHEFSPNSGYTSGAHAFSEGYKSGAKWGAANGWVLYFGLPSTAFEESFLTNAASSLANRGVLGNGVSLIQRGWTALGGKSAGNWGDRFLGWMMSKGGTAGTVFGTTVSMGDQFAKYYVFNKGVESIAYHASYQFNSVDSGDVERRIKRAQAAGMHAMEMPYWALIPTFSARTAQAVEQSQHSQQGFAEYKKAGELDRIANAAADIAVLPLKNAPQRPFLTRLFEFNLMEATGQKGEFKVTKDMKYDAIRLELERSVTNNGRQPANPYEYYRISQMERGTHDRLHITEEVRDQAQGLFETAVLESPALARRIMSAQPGSRLDGFGLVRLGHQEEVARVLFIQNRGGKSVPAAELAQARAILEPYLKSEEHVTGKAAEMLTALSKNTNPTPVYQKFVDGMLERTQTWKAEGGTKYMDLVAEFRTGAKNSAMAPHELNVITKMMDFLEAIQTRFTTFNQVGTASGRAQRALSALLTEAKGGGAASPLVAKTIDGMLSKLSSWRNEHPSLETAVGKTYYEMVNKIKQEVEGLRKKLSPGDHGLLETAVKDLEAAPSLLRDAKGGSLPGWRPEQFEGLMHFLHSVAKDGANTSEVIRTFLLMKTGGGKTLLAYEGLLPVAEADSGLHGGKKLKTIFLTVQSNLESQARLEFRSMKKLLSDLTIDTWEGFKSKIAQNKLENKGGAEDYWILGDEMDGAALQPALTIGETTAGIGRENSGYRLLKSITERMKELLDRGPAEVRKLISSDARRQQTLVDTMAPSETQAKLRGTTEELVSLSERMTQLQKRGDMAGLEGLAKRVEKVLTNQRELLRGADPAVSTGVLEAGSRISETVRNRGAVGRSDWKQVKVRFADMLREQEAVLAQTAPLGEKQAAALRRVAKVQREAGNVTEAAKLEARASKIIAETAEARAGIESNARAFKDLLREGKPGWEQAARKLVSERSSLVERSVVKENPIYEVFRRMREDMYQLVHSKTRVTQTSERLATTPERTAQTLEVAADVFSIPRQKLLTEAAALRQEAHGKPPAEARTLLERADKLTERANSKAPAYQLAESLRREAVGKPPAEAQALVRRASEIITHADARAASLRAQAAEARQRIGQPLNAEQQAAVEARAQAHEKLMSAERKVILIKSELRLAGSKPAAELHQALKAAESEAARWRADYKKVNDVVNASEASRAQAAQSILTELKLETARAGEAWAQRLQGLKGLEADALRRALSGLERSFENQAKALEWTPQRAVDVLQRRITGVSATEYVSRLALQYTGLQWVMSKVPGLRSLGWSKWMTAHEVGLTRTYAQELMWGFMFDPFIPPQVRWKMLWTMGSSLLWPRGITGRGTSWVLTELLNLATGYTDNAANIRVDNITGKVNAIHNGQWFESMDTPTRRYWELEYNTDLTLPYEHKTQVTLNDFVRDNLNARFVGFSGTAGPRFREYLGNYKVEIAGVGSASVKDVLLKLHEGPGGKLTEIGNAVREALSHDAAMLAAGKQADALVVLSLPDTRTVKAVRKYLLRMKILTPDQISMVFSDAELLRVNRPEANVAQQMNLGGLKDGKVKLLILDTRVGGRGLDLDFKGYRNPRPDQFGGYFDFNMLVIDPQFASEAHFLQAQGRIDLGRVYSSLDPSRSFHPEAAVRRFSMVLDLQTAMRDPVFMRMLRTEPIFQQLRAHPRVVEIAFSNGRFTPSWADINAFVAESRANGREGFVTELYEGTVRKYLAEKQTQIELDQLRSSGVLQDAGSFDPSLYGLQPVVPGTLYPGGF